MTTSDRFPTEKGSGMAADRRCAAVYATADPVLFWSKVPTRYTTGATLRGAYGSGHARATKETTFRPGLGEQSGEQLSETHLNSEKRASLYSAERDPTGLKVPAGGRAVAVQILSPRSFLPAKRIERLRVNWRRGPIRGQNWTPPGTTLRTVWLRPATGTVLQTVPDRVVAAVKS
jgi:hypothetical protein